MAKAQVLDYYINLEDAALVAQLQAQIDDGNAGTVDGPYEGQMLNLPEGGFAIFLSPDEAAVTFAEIAGAPAFPVWNVEDTKTPSAGGYIDGPNLYTNNRYPKDERFFTRSSGWWIFGEETRFYWAGHVRYIPHAAIPVDDGVTEPTEPDYIPVRYALSCAGQMHINASRPPLEAQASTSLDVARNASRLGGGFGWQMSRDTAVVQSLSYNHQGTPRARWERFNIMIPFAPDVMTQIWRGQQGAISGEGFGFAVLPTLQIAVMSYSSSSTYTITGVFGDAMVAGEWYKFDVLFDVDASGGTITLTVLRNGAALIATTRSAGGAMGSRTFVNSGIGQFESVATTAMFCFSDYIIAEPPNTRRVDVATWNSGTAYTIGTYVRLGGNTYRCIQNGTNKTPGARDPVPDGSNWAWWRKLTDPVDFQQGSHLQWVGPEAFASSHGAWTGDVRLVMQKGGSTTQDSLTSTSSGAICSVTTNLERDIENIPGFIGWAAAQVNANNSRGGAPSGSVGYKRGALAPVDTAVTQSVTLFWNSVVYSLPASTQTLIGRGETFELRHTKAADVTTGRVSSLSGVIECIGRFTPCDNPVSESADLDAPVIVSTDDPYPNGLHNCHYPYSPWHRQRSAMAPIIVRGATYVGTGTGITLSFPLPPTLIMIRNFTAGQTEPHFVWPTLMEAHTRHGYGGDWGTKTTKQEQDLDFVQGDPASNQQLSFDLHIGSAHADINAIGVTYQYIAFMDPAARFSRSDVIVGKDLIAPRTHSLVDSNFTPEVLFTWLEAAGNLTTPGLYHLGPGFAAGTIYAIASAGTIASALTVGAGTIIATSAWFAAGSYVQYGYVAFRRQDGNDDPDEGKAMFLGSYVGDGTASRTINVAPTTGLRPLFLFIQPTNNVGHYRDPSHTTNTSSAMNNPAALTTSITAGGTDSFTIGLNLNANGITYSYWGLWGSATAGNGGWSINGDFVQVGADSYFPPGWEEPSIIDPPEEPPEPGNGDTAVEGEEPDLDTETEILDTTFNVGGLLGGRACEFYTRKLVNRALSRIGITKVIDNLATDNTEYAVVARRHVLEDINAVLRDHPWAFATRYQELTLSSGSATAPFNNDWTYAYLAPNSMMFARRVASQPPGRSYGYAPVLFRHYMSPTLGPLILCNAEGTDDTPLVLEYTIRHQCPAFFGDAIFRDALVWRFAKSLASSLARDSAKAQYCEGMYRDVLNRASTVVEREQQQDKHGDADWIDARG